MRFTLFCNILTIINTGLIHNIFYEDLYDLKINEERFNKRLRELEHKEFLREQQHNINKTKIFLDKEDDICSNKDKGKQK